MPLAARFRFDSCGVRPSLAQWRAMSLETRREVVNFDLYDAAQVDAFRHFLSLAVEQTSGEPLACFAVDHPLPWDAAAPPAQLVAAHATLAGTRDRAVSVGLEQLSLDQLHLAQLPWAQLPRLHRYVLCKLSEPAKAHRLRLAFDHLTAAGSARPAGPSAGTL